MTESKPTPVLVSWNHTSLDMCELIQDYFDAHIKRLIMDAKIIVEPVIETEAHREEAEFTRQLLIDPGEDSVRKIFADWLEEHDRHAQAKYLREIRRHKFVRRVKQLGSWALQQTPPMPRRIHLIAAMDTSPNLSKRAQEIARRIRRGWTLPKHIWRALKTERALFIHPFLAKFLGVFIEDVLAIIPLLNRRHENH